MKILLIVPAYNEEKSILNTYNMIDLYNKKSNIKLDVIIINDGSKDKTQKVLEKNNIPHINLIQNLGIGGAVQTGYKYAYLNNYDIAIQFDGDGQHDVNYVSNIIEPIIKNNADFVIGSRFIDKTSSEFKSTGARRVGIKIISFFIKLFTGKTIKDPTSGFRAANKKVIELFQNYYPTEYPEPESSVVLLKNKFKLKEIPVKMHERKEGKSSIRAWKSIYYMINVCLSLFIVSIRRYK